MRSWVGKALLVVASLGFAGLLLEGGLRLLSPVSFMAPAGDTAQGLARALVHRASAVPGLAYELTPGAEAQYRGARLRVNREGMRDDEPPDAPRIVIAAVGDSYTFGQGVGGDEFWANALERRLNDGQEGERFSVKNFGVGGYSSRDEALVFEHKVLDHDPALVIVGYVLNDPEIDPVQPLHRSFREPEWWQHSNVLRLLAWQRRQWVVRVHGDGDYLRHLHAPGRAKWQSVQAAFARIATLARQRGIPVLVAVFPVNWHDTWAAYAYADLHDQVVEEAETNGLAAIDLLPDFRRHSADAMRLPGGDPHPSARAHDAAAAAMEEWIRANTELLEGEALP